MNKNLPNAVRRKIEVMIENYQNEEIKSALQEVLYFSNALPVVGIFWDEDDVKSVMEEMKEDNLIDDYLTEEEIGKVMRRIVVKHDCEIGVNWGTISFQVEEVLAERTSQC